ncbi:ABC transporter substrate-binding protein [Streptomyces scabiei]|uniref:ABC transporter substrate-binding protein n=1 Tax=Streptomyces scabiei TaxID=1930 RepID=UPI00340547D3
MRRLLTGLAAGTLFVTATACGSLESDGGDAGSGGTTTLKLGVVPVIDVAPLYLGEAKGFYSERGLDLEPTLAQGGAEIVPGVVSGEFDFGFGNMTSLLVARSKNMPVEAVVNGVASTGKAGADFAGVMVRKGSPIRTASDLEGRKVAADTRGDICDTSVNESVRKDGGDPAEVEYVEMPFDRMPAALAKGQVDAACVMEPALATVKSRGGTVLASSFVDVSPYLTVAMYFTSHEYAAKNPETVKRFQEATAESLAYADEHPDEVRDIVATYTKIPQNQLESVVLPHWPTEPDRASIERLAELGQKDGLFEKSPDLDELLP